MAALGVATRMAKKKAGRPKTSTGSGPTVRIESDIMSMIRYIAARKGLTAAKLASDLIRPAVEREFAKAAPKIDKDPGEKR